MSRPFVVKDAKFAWLSRFPKWAKTHVHPYGQDLSSQRSNDLFAAVDENSKQEFFKVQGGRRQENEYLVYDTTSLETTDLQLKLKNWGELLKLAVEKGRTAQAKDVACCRYVDVL